MMKGYFNSIQIEFEPDTADLLLEGSFSASFAERAQLS